MCSAIASSATASVEMEAINKELTAKNARSFLKDAGLVLDTFDNSASRQLVQEHCRGWT